MNRPCATTAILCLLSGWMVAIGDGFSLGGSRGRSSTTISPVRSSSTDDAEADVRTATRDVVGRVAVTGATGKTGRLVVDELLRRGVRVLGLVRNETKASEAFGGRAGDAPEIRECDLSDPEAVADALRGCDAAIWCATGFTVDPAAAQTPMTDAVSEDQSIDVVGVPAVARAMLRATADDDEPTQAYPKVIMCSSAGTTRPGWDQDKKERLKGCADIPIVRLNPFGILGLKEEGERRLRESGVEYCIVRPCGLNDEWPAGARPVVSQGDVAVGRINRADLAGILVDVLSLPQAARKTFEVTGLAGYPPPRDGVGPALQRLRLDDEGLSEQEVETAYGLAQQFLPGERQDAAALAMGQTYEQLDRGETGRLGVRGEEDVGAAGVVPTTSYAQAG